MPELAGSTYSEIDAANSAAAPNGMPEGMPPSGVNDSWRAGMGALMRFWGRIQGKYAASGSANAYVLTPDAPLAAYAIGERYSFRAGFANTGAATVDISALGAKGIKKMGVTGKVDPEPGDIQIGQPVTVEYDGMDMVMVTPPASAITGPDPTLLLPTGVSMNYLGTAAPSGWVLSAGGTIGDSSSGATERASPDCENLFTLIYNSGGDAQFPISTSDGTPTVRSALGTALEAWAAHARLALPDMRGRVAIGKDDMGGVAAGRITTNGSGIAGATLGAAGGEETTTLTIDQIPAHTHTLNVAGITLAGQNGGPNSVRNVGTTDSGSAGGSGAHNNAQPSLVWNVIIKL